MFSELQTESVTTEIKLNRRLDRTFIQIKNETNFSCFYIRLMSETMQRSVYNCYYTTYALISCLTHKQTTCLHPLTSLLYRNAALEGLFDGGQPPKPMKTGTTIAGVVFKVSITLLW